MPQGRNKVTGAEMISNIHRPIRTAVPVFGTNPQSGRNKVSTRRRGERKTARHKQGPSNQVGGAGKVSTTPKDNSIRNKSKNVKGQVSEKRAKAGQHRGQQPLKMRSGTPVQSSIAHGAGGIRVSAWRRGGPGTAMKRERRIPGRNPPKKEPR